MANKYYIRYPFSILENTKGTKVNGVEEINGMILDDERWISTILFNYKHLALILASDLELLVCWNWEKLQPKRDSCASENSFRSALCTINIEMRWNRIKWKNSLQLWMRSDFEWGRYTIVKYTNRNDTRRVKFWWTKGTERAEKIQLTLFPT